MAHRRGPKAPSHLSPKTSEWWASVVDEFCLKGHHLRLLQLACEAFDRCTEAREILGRDGLTIPTGDGGLKAHPAVAIERDARIGFMRALRELDLDVSPPDESRRPPGLRSNRRL